MPSAKPKLVVATEQTKEENTISEQEFQKALRTFQKTAQQKKSEIRKREFFLSPRDEKRAKQIALRKKKKIKR